MAKLRDQLIKLAYKREDLRPHILPLLEDREKTARKPRKKLFPARLRKDLYKSFGRKRYGFFRLYSELKDFYYDENEDPPEDGFARTFRQFSKQILRKMEGEILAEKFRNSMKSVVRILKRIDRSGERKPRQFKKLIAHYADLIEFAAKDRGIFLDRKKLQYPGWIRFLPGEQFEPEPLFSEEVRSLPEKEGQDLDDPEELYDQAEESHEEQLDWLDRGQGIDQAIGANVARLDEIVQRAEEEGWSGEETGERIEEVMEKQLKSDEPMVVIGPMKGRDRAEEKVEADYGGDWSQLTDMVRATIAVNTYEELEDLIQELKDSGLELSSQPTNRFRNPTDSGYRDMKLNVEFENGHVGELQVHVKPILREKQIGKGHELYEKVREIKAEAKKEGREELTEEEQREINETNRKAKEIYEEAWQESLTGDFGEKQSSYQPSFTGEEFSMDKEGAERTRYYRFDDHPAYWKAKMFPVKIVMDGQGGTKEKVVYDLEKFFHEAMPIRKDKYDSLKEDLKSRSKTSSRHDEGNDLRSDLIRLAYNKPGLRDQILPLLQDD